MRKEQVARCKPLLERTRPRRETESQISYNPTKTCDTEGSQIPRLRATTWVLPTIRHAMRLDRNMLERRTLSEVNHPETLTIPVLSRLPIGAQLAVSEPTWIGFFEEGPTAMFMGLNQRRQPPDRPGKVFRVRGGGGKDFSSTEPLTLGYGPESIVISRIWPPDRVLSTLKSLVTSRSLLMASVVLEFCISDVNGGRQTGSKRKQVPEERSRGDQPDRIRAKNDSVLVVIDANHPKHQ